MTFSASGASEKEKAFIVTAERREDRGISSPFKHYCYSCGFGTALTFEDSNIKIGSITPQEIDGFKITSLQDMGYSEINYDTGDADHYNVFEAVTNRKCILHIKGKDYNITYVNADGTFSTETDYDPIGINDKEQIKVTYTLL